MKITTREEKIARQKAQAEKKIRDDLVKMVSLLTNSMDNTFIIRYHEILYNLFAYVETYDAITRSKEGLLKDVDNEKLSIKLGEIKNLFESSKTKMEDIVERERFSEVYSVDLSGSAIRNPSYVELLSYIKNQLKLLADRMSELQLQINIRAALVKIFADW